MRLEPQQGLLLTCSWKTPTENLHILLHFFQRILCQFRSTRVSNELGAGNPQAAKVTVCAVMVLAMVEMIVVSTALFSYRHILGYAFSSDKEIVKRIADMAPLISLSIVTDGLQAVLSGLFPKLSLTFNPSLEGNWCL